MKRLFTTCFAAGLLAGVLFAPATAAASATCTIHSLTISAWSEQTDTVSYQAHFKCGGTTSQYRVKITMQEDLGGWTQPGCIAGPCITYRPSATTWYTAGDDNAWQGNFNIASSIHNQDFRVRGDVIFKNGDPTQTWFSNRQTV